jgi:hypothetical protein
MHGGESTKATNTLSVQKRISGNILKKERTKLSDTKFEEDHTQKVLRINAWIISEKIQVVLFSLSLSNLSF